MMYPNTEIPQDEGQQQGETSTNEDWSPWAYMKLQWGEASSDGLGLLLTISFGEHYKQVLGGQVWFGLRASALQLEATNATIPYRHRWPDSSLPVKIDVKRCVSEARSSKQARSHSEMLNANGSVKDVGASASASRKNETGEEQAARVQDEFEYVDWQIQTRGSEKNAYWDFEALPGKPCLAGYLTEQEVGKLIACAEPCCVRATLRVFKKDIRLLSGQGLWPEDLGKAKKTVILGLLRKYIAWKMGPVVYSFELPRGGEG